METNYLSLWPNLVRAIEVAKVGGHSICIVNELVDEYPTRCFNKDVEFIKNLCVGNFNIDFKASALDADIVVSINPINEPYFTFKNRLESFEEVQARIEKALKTPEPSTEMDSSTTQLLKTAMFRLKFSVPDVISIQEMACTIAKMDGAAKIQLEHVAEAIQYKAHLANDDI